LPPEFKHDRAAYVQLVADVMIPAMTSEGLADAVDAFCENIGFTAGEVDYVFSAARANGLDVKLHAEQLSNQHGAALAARHKALSADHLEYLDDAGIAAMAEAGTVAVLLPGAFHFLKQTQAPPVAKLRAVGVKMAVATDCNPGTSPLTSPLMAMNLACTLFRLTPEEALAGMTREGARALGLQDEIGTLEAGKAADFAVWNVSAPAELSYWMGAPLLRERVFAGRVVERTAGFQPALAFRLRHRRKPKHRMRAGSRRSEGASTASLLQAGSSWDIPAASPRCAPLTP
jgi:imidazolonepropionase